jgi:hypothetical protein
MHGFYKSFTIVSSFPSRDKTDLDFTKQNMPGISVPRGDGGFRNTEDGDVTTPAGAFP